MQDPTPRVLCTEDHTDTRDLIVFILRAEGFELPASKVPITLLIWPGVNNLICIYWTIGRLVYLVFNSVRSCVNLTLTRQYSSTQAEHTKLTNNALSIAGRKDI